MPWVLQNKQEVPVGTEKLSQAQGSPIIQFFSSHSQDGKKGAKARNQKREKTKRKKNRKPVVGMSYKAENK